jgi:hypothetical protein
MHRVQVLRAPVFVARRLGLGSNPLRRKWDRIEGAALAAVIVAVVMMVPLAVWSGARVHAQGLHEVEAQTGSRHQAEAVLLANAPADDRGDAGPFVAIKQQVAARWYSPDGTQRVGQIEVDAGTKGASRIPVWLDQKGQLVGAPLTPNHAAERAVYAGIGTQLGAVMALVFLFRLFCRRLDRHRLSWWEAEWARVAPQWTRRGR